MLLTPLKAFLQAPGLPQLKANKTDTKVLRYTANASRKSQQHQYCHIADNYLLQKYYQNTSQSKFWQHVRNNNLCHQLISQLKMH